MPQRDLGFGGRSSSQLSHSYPLLHQDHQDCSHMFVLPTTDFERNKPQNDESIETTARSKHVSVHSAPRCGSKEKLPTPADAPV